MNEPEQPAPAEWENLRFHPRRPGFARVQSSDASATRFLIGLVTFLLVAALYPWYSYRVQSHLVASDLAEAVSSMQQETDRDIARLNRQMAQASADQQEHAQQQRLQRVQVMGGSIIHGRPVVIVELGKSSLQEAKPIICRTASGWLGVPVAGRRLEVQQHRGKSPTVSVGWIQC